MQNSLLTPFYSSYIHSDVLGKGIYLLLFLASAISLSLIIYKMWFIQRAYRRALDFQEEFQKSRSNPLAVQYEENEFNPFYAIYAVLRKETIDLLSKNKHYQKENSSNFLSSTDINTLESHCFTTISRQTLVLERYLYVLSTIVSLAPFLGILGTVWGILVSFSAMQQGAASTSQATLSGLSLAMATTVLGLIGAIPALIGYNYLKNKTGEFSVFSEEFASKALLSIELQYRKVDLE